MMTVNLPMDPRKMPDGVILVFSIRYPGMNEQLYMYAMMKAGGCWYGTGAGKVPQAAGWRAVENWLDRDGRVVDRVEIVTGQRTIWPVPVEAAEPDLSDSPGLGPVDTLQL